jgi:hypothetical protein
MKAAINNWSWTGRSITWGIFKDLEPLLNDSPNPLTPEHSRLMLEDFMLSEPGDQLLCFVTKSFHFFTGAGKSSFIKDFIQSMKNDPWKPTRFQNNVYFAITVTVKSNVHLNDFKQKSKSKTIPELIYMCSKIGGAGITLTLPNQSTKLIKFYDVLHHCNDLQLWATKGTKRITLVKKALRGIKDTERLGPIVHRFLDEVYGDRFLTSAYLDTYDLLMAKALAAKQLKTYKTEPISTERLTRHLHLDNKDPTFQAFREYFDGVAKAAIMDVYGGFSAFTTPLLSQHVLAEVADRFKTDFPQFYSAISIFLNKQVRQLSFPIFSFLIP